MENVKLQLSKNRSDFNERYADLNDSDIQREILFAQKITNIKLEKIRSNTSVLVWFLIVIPFILAILIGLFYNHSF